MVDPDPSLPPKEQTGLICQFLFGSNSQGKGHSFVWCLLRGKASLVDYQQPVDEWVYVVISTAWSSVAVGNWLWLAAVVVVVLMLLRCRWTAMQCSSAGACGNEGLGEWVRAIEWWQLAQMLLLMTATEEEFVRQCWRMEMMLMLKLAQTKAAGKYVVARFATAQQLVTDRCDSVESDWPDDRSMPVRCVRAATQDWVLKRSAGRPWKPS